MRSPRWADDIDDEEEDVEGEEVAVEVWACAPMEMHATAKTAGTRW
jgi:hypothetical protein